MRVWRGIARRPVATTVIVLTLGIGLGAVAVIGALLGSVLFPRVPYRDPQKLVVLWSSVRPGATERADYLMPKRADAWLAAPPRSLNGVAAVGPTTGILRRPDATHRIQIAAVSTSFFSTLGVSAARGRLLAPIDSFAQPSVVLSDRAWRRYFRSDRRVLGQTIAVDSAFYTVVGIAPAELDYPRETDAWVLRTHMLPNRHPPAWLLLGRLRAGADLETARAEVIARSQAEHPADSIANAGYGVTAVPLSELDRNLQGLLPLVAVGTAALYLVAALNLGILLLLRVGAQSHELAIRAALGSGVWGALRPLVAEIGAQFALGASLALVGGLAVMRVIRSRFLFQLAPLTGRAELVVIAVVLTLALITAAFAFAGVARRVRAADLFGALRGSGEALTGDPHAQRIRRWLVAGEIAVAIVLACIAGITARSLWHFRGLEVGYDAEQVIVARPDYEAVRYGHERQAALAEAVRARLLGANRSGETSYWRRIGLSWPPLPEERVFAIDGAIPAGSGQLYQHYEVGPRFFETLNAPMLEGRSFDKRDRRGSLAVAVINRAAAERWWPNESPLGRRVSLNPTDPSSWLTVVGVADIIAIDPLFDRAQLARGVARPQLFRPLSQAGPKSTPYWNWGEGCFVCPRIAVAARGGSANRTLGQVIRELESNLPLAATRSMYEEQVGGWDGSWLRAHVRAMTGFAGLAVLLALLGVYGVVADAVSTRKRELAIRIALGATAARLLRMLLRENGLISLVAVAAGAFLYFLTERTAGSLLFGGQYRPILYRLSAVDPGIIVPILMLSMLMVTLAIVTGARPALTADPREGLRSE